ncbi:MAG: MFS transporter [Deltaproteobacteria bacterium]|nr:MFS transporter [Deltaproteobacteria bacterium]
MPQSGSSSQEPSSLRSQIGVLLMIAGLFLLNFLSRLILSPLVPAVEEDLGITHSRAGVLFLAASMGYCSGLLFSGFISSRLTHRQTIILSSSSVGLILVATSFAETFWVLALCVLLLGLAAGPHLPSGLATITTLVDKKDWGKALSIHELAPNFGFIIAPIFAEALLTLTGWQSAFGVLGPVVLLMSLGFAFFGRGGDFHGEALRPKTILGLMRRGSFWVMLLFFGLGIGGSLAVYNMVPLYLVAEHGMSRSSANTLLAFSRILGLAAAFLAGWATDRLGAKKSIGISFLTTGLLTLLLGLAPSEWAIWIVFLQPTAAVTFFPPGFAALSLIGSPTERNVVVSMIVPFGFLLGSGVVSAFIGFCGDMGSFSLGISVFGAVILCSLGLLRYLRFHE